MKNLSQKKSVKLMLGTLVALGMYTSPAIAANSATTTKVSWLLGAMKIVIRVSPDLVKRR